MRGRGGLYPARLMPSRPSLLAAALVAAALLAPPAPASAAVRTGPAGAAFYTPPANLPGVRHGDPIWVRSMPATNSLRLAGASRNLLVLYRSTRLDGRPTAVSGAIALPKGKAPAGGWPVITWAHGTTGIADQCAPTRQGRSTATYAVRLRAQLQRYLAAGYAVVSTDYEGLGTPGGHPFLVGRSEGRSVLDIVRAARKVDRRVGRRVGIIGHSQGGHAAIWAASLARTWTPELDVRGTVAYAPASHIADQAGILDAVRTPSALSAFAAMIFRGQELVRPSLAVQQLLSDKVTGLYPRVDERCFSELTESDSWGGIAPSEIVKEGADRGPLLAAVDESDPENLRIRTPLWIAQGTADATVLPPFTDQLDEELRAKGATVTYRRYEGVDHTGIVERARTGARSFLRGRLGR